MTLDRIFPLYKNQLKMDKKPQCKLGTLKLLEEKVWSMLQNKLQQRKQPSEEGAYRIVGSLCQLHLQQRINTWNIQGT